MKYSVWNTATATYDYYEAPGTLRAGVIAPTPRLPSGGRLGLAPQRAGRPLPVGAVLTGSGPYAQGMVATRNGGALGDFFGMDIGELAKFGVIAAGAWLLWTRVLSPTHRRKATLWAHGRRRKR